MLCPKKYNFKMAKEYSEFLRIQQAKRDFSNSNPPAPNQTVNGKFPGTSPEVLSGTPNKKIFLLEMHSTNCALKKKSKK